MGDLFRCYKGYTSFTYRLLFACLFPIALFLFTCFVAKTGMDWMIGGLLFSLFTYESMGDFLAYAGLCKEGNRDSSFLKTSIRGKRLFCRVIVVDLIRRLLVVSGMMIIAWFFDGAGLPLLLLLGYLMILVGINICRCFDSSVIVLSIWSLIYILTLLGNQWIFWGIGKHVWNVPMVFALEVILAIGLNGITLYHMMWRERGDKDDN